MTDQPEPYTLPAHEAQVRAYAAESGDVVLRRHLTAVLAEYDKRARRLELGENLHRIVEQRSQQLHDQLRPLCPCDYNPDTTDGPQQECVMHGDGVTFVAEFNRLRAVEKAAAALVESRRPGAGDPFYGKTWTGYEPHLVGRVELDALADALNGEQP